MHSDIAKIIAIIDQRIETLRDLRAKLVGEFGEGEEKKLAPESSPDQIQRFPRLAPPRASRNGGPSRKQQVAEFIRSGGPQTRASLLAGIDIPKGTLAYVLNDKQMFQQLKDGKWATVQDK